LRRQWPSRKLSTEARLGATWRGQFVSKEIKLVFLVLAVNLLTLPIVSLMILRLTTDRKLMGDYVNGWFTNTVLVLAVIAALFLSGTGLAELVQDLQK